MKQVQHFYAKQLVFGKEISAEKGTAFLGDRTIFFIGVKYSFQTLNVWRIYESQKNTRVLFIRLPHHGGWHQEVAGSDSSSSYASYFK